jgi:hypothetical protein
MKPTQVHRGTLITPHTESSRATRAGRATTIGAKMTKFHQYVEALLDLRHLDRSSASA